MEMTPAERRFLVQERGFVFERTLTGEIEIVLVGDNNCGKTQLIQSIFGDNPSLTRTNFGTREDYRVTMTNVLFHIVVQDVKAAHYVQNTTFFEKCVFLFCYDVNNESSFEKLKEIWIPAVVEKSLKKMYSLLVGIKREPGDTAGAAAHQPVTMSLEESFEFCSQFQITWPVKCSLEDRDSMLNVFQTSIDQVYPRTSLN